jgi:hypothetical protein
VLVLPRHLPPHSAPHRHPSTRLEYFLHQLEEFECRLGGFSGNRLEWGRAWSLSLSCEFINALGENHLVTCF